MTGRPRQGATRLFLLVFAGTLLVQAAWSLVVPPFRGLDEHDHAYKAAAVARGDWSPDHPTSDQGWGDFVVVPQDLVLAANPICVSLPYTSPDNCNPGDPQGSGLVTVASSAARYNPAFYFVVGSAARPFSGVEALYAMRAASALLCALLIALAAVATSGWARTRWPFAALLLAATPVAIYSTSVVAPNGLEMAAAMLLWSALLGVARPPPEGGRGRFLALATVAVVPLTTLRTLGPLWCALILLTVATLLSRQDLWALRRSRAARALLAVTAASTAAAVAWTLAAGTNSVPESSDPTPGNLLAVLPEQWVLWFFQAVAAFPSRTERAPLVLYAIAFAAWWVFAALSWRLASRRERRSVVLVVVLASAVPIAMTVLTYRDLGTAWQGRYGYPFAMGFILICGFALDRRWKAGTRLPTTAVWIAAAVYAATHTIGQLGVLKNQLEISPLAGDSRWMVAPAPVVVALASAGVLVQAVAMTGVRRACPDEQTPAPSPSTAP